MRSKDDYIPSATIHCSRGYSFNMGSLFWLPKSTIMYVALKITNTEDYFDKMLEYNSDILPCTLFKVEMQTIQDFISTAAVINSKSFFDAGVWHCFIASVMPAMNAITSESCYVTLQVTTLHEQCSIT